MSDVVGPSKRTTWRQYEFDEKQELRKKKKRGRKREAYI